MALVAHNGLPIRSPMISDITYRWGLNTADVALIDASTEKCAFMGFPWFPGYGTKNIRKVKVRTATVAINSASQVRISLQDLDTATGTPPQPDGSVDQSVTLAGSAFSSNAVIDSGAFDTDRSYTWGGDPIAVVIEYTTFTAADSLQFICNYRRSIGANAPNGPLCGFYNGSAWSTLSYIPNISFEADDGTIGCFFNAPMFSGSGTQTFSTAEWGLKFQVAEPCTLVGATAFYGCNVDGRDMILRLYDGANNVLASRTWLGEWNNTSGESPVDLPLAAYDLSAETTYYLALAPNTGAADTGLKQFLYMDVPTTSHVEMWGYGSGSCIVNRATPGSGAWTEDTDRLPAIVPYFGKFRGSGSGGYQIGLV